MTDTHTHILPGMDDGAADLAQSLDMLTECRAQGVETVVLTPHFYPDRESLDRFLERRARSFELLRAAVTQEHPKLVLGAEVAWYPGIETMKCIRELTMGKTDYLLLEMPYMEWEREQMESISNLLSDGLVTPVLAHVERYLRLQCDGQFQTLLNMRLPMQLSAGFFGKLFGGRKAVRLLGQGSWMIGSDCHDLTNRPPCMASAARYLQQKAPDLTYALNWKFY